jgi:hypothetical protein
MTERNGVEIDYCPTCRGVWLDRGELDKIIARSQADAAPPVPLREPLRETGREARREPERAYRDERRDERRDDRRDDRHRDDDDDYRYRRKRRDSFLSDLFDF